MTFRSPLAERLEPQTRRKTSRNKSWAGSRTSRSRSTWARSPYITAGLAGFNIKTNLGDVVPGEQDESATKFAVNGGLGLSMKLFGASAFVEAKLNNIYTDGKAIGGKELKDLQFVPVTFGFVF